MYNLGLTVNVKEKKKGNGCFSACTTFKKLIFKCQLIEDEAIERKSTSYSK